VTAHSLQKESFPLVATYKTMKQLNPQATSNPIGTLGMSMHADVPQAAPVIKP
jgi:hypothetical protein